MRLPRHMLTASCLVLGQAKSPPDRLGQSTLTWQAEAQPTLCAHFPAGAKVLELAQLRGVKVAREVYLERKNLNPQTNRLRIEGVDYQITLVNDWPWGAVLGVISE